MNEFRLLIDGALVPGADTMAVVDPATGQTFTHSPRGSLAQMNSAVEAAQRAFPAWAATPVEDRRAALTAIAGAVDAAAETLVPLFVREHGTTLAAARIELMVFGFKLRQAAAAVLPAGSIDAGAGHQVEQRLRPLGVVAAIIPWNVPLVLFGSKLASALLVGNTVVAKPAPTTPLTTLRIGEIIAPLLPPGVLNIVTDANDLGGALTTHPSVRMVTFTGSTMTGRKVMEASATRLTRILLELGGNDPAIVLADADVEATAQTIFRSAFFNNGQACIATKRVYAHDAIYDDLCAALGRLVSAVRIGNGMEDGVDYGPMQNKAQYDRVRALVERAEQNGAVLARAPEPAPSGGYFIAPRLVGDLPEDDPLVAEEQFGPILPVLRFSDVDDVVARANASPYGLAASVFSADMDMARSVAARIEAGTVTINKSIDFHPDVPFTGAKQSGYGIDGGSLGLIHYGQLQVVDRATPVDA